MAIESTLFQHLNFLIVVTEAGKLEAAQKIASVLRLNASNRCEIYRAYVEEDKPKQCDVKDWFLGKYGGEEMINLIISESCDFPFYYIAAFDYLIPVVRPEWVDTCLSTKRHHRTSGFSPDRRHILRDCQIYVSRHAFKHAEYLFYTEMVHAMGGTCIDFLSNRTSHLVTTDSKDPAVSAVVGFGKVDSIRFVFPTWIVQSFKELSIANAEEHAIDSSAAPEVLEERLQDLWGAVNDLEFIAKSTILEDHSFIIGLDVSLSKDLYSTLIEFLQANGGTVIRHVDEEDIRRGAADCYIGSSVMSKEYEVASNSGLDLGNLIWIFYMWSCREFHSVKSKIIFPPFKKKLFETSELILSYSNYFGGQRFYIQRLAEMLGGYSTAELSRKNTHLVSQFSWGKKFDTGRSWGNCAVVNHLWLEETYKCGFKIDPKETRFQQFPVSGGLRGALGQMTADNFLPQDVKENGAKTPEVAAGGSVISLFNAKEDEGKENGQEPSANPKGDSSEPIAGTETPKGSVASDDIRGENSIIELPDLSVDKSVAEVIESASAMEALEALQPLQDSGHIAAEDGILSEQVEVKELEASESESVSRPLPVLSEKDSLESIQGRNQALVDDKVRQQTPENKLSSQENDHFIKGDELVEAADEKGQKTEFSEKTSNADLISLTPNHAANLSEDHDNHITPVSHKTRSQTPMSSLTPSHPLLSSGGIRRAAKEKAALKLHDDIETLNEYQRSSKRKKTGSLLPQEIALLERRKLLQQEAKNILETLSCEENSIQMKDLTAPGRKNHLYHMDAICTGSHEDIVELDKCILELLGIKIHEDITALNSSKLNAVIAPKKMRTAKFLKSYSFHPLKYALRPDFLTDLLFVIHSGQVRSRQDMLLDLSKYTIPEVDTDLLLRKTSLPNKIFERAGLSNINLVSDVAGGVEVISSILKIHGVKDVKVLPATQMGKLTINDLALNDGSQKSEREEEIPDYLIIVTKSSQVKHFKRMVKNERKNVMAVEWNWCISSIFGLDVDYTAKENVIYHQDLSSEKKTSLRSK